MPLGYLALHMAVFVLALAAGALITHKKRRAGIVLAACAVFGGLTLQLLVLKFPRFFANLLGWQDLFFFSKFSVHVAAVVIAVAVVAQKRTAIRIRAAVLGAVLLSLACYASRDVFVAPPGLHPGEHFHPHHDGHVSEVVKQSETSSCAPAAAATLLRAMDLAPAVTEADLAKLCFTDPLAGTSDLGLYRGLRMAAPGRRVRFRTRGIAELKALKTPCMVFVGLDRERVGDPKLFDYLRDECNWREGEPHAVVCFGFARDTKDGVSYDVAIIGDPNFGMERWALSHFEVLWDGTTLEVE